MFYIYTYIYVYRLLNPVLFEKMDKKTSCHSIPLYERVIHRKKTTKI